MADTATTDERVDARKRLGALADRVAAAQDHLDDERAARDAAIVECVEAGHHIRAVAQWARVSERRVGSILERT